MTRTTVEFHTEWTIADPEDDRTAEAKQQDEEPAKNAKALPAQKPQQKPAYLVAGASGHNHL